MDDLILITELNDFIFCPVSIYFHKLYGDMEKMVYQTSAQINGTNAHKAVDNSSYSSERNVYTGIDLYCEEYGLIGKIDMFDNRNGILRERKKKIKQIYDGYVFQLYAQYFALKEMNYEVKVLELYSMDDHKKYNIPLPEEDFDMLTKFKETINEIKNFKMESFSQTNALKCKNCIYEPACDRAALE